MPGLLRGVARTAVVAGTATAVSNRVTRRQTGRWAAQQGNQGYQEYRQPAPSVPPAATPSPPTAAGGDMTSTIDQLKELGDLRSQGVLTQEEFEEQKRRLLAG